jgi:hypothetical protein
VGEQFRQQRLNLGKLSRTSERLKMRDLTRRLEAVGLEKSVTAGKEQLMRVMATIGAKKQAALETGIADAEMASVAESMEGMSIEAVEEL